MGVHARGHGQQVAQQPVLRLAAQRPGDGDDRRPDRAGTCNVQDLEDVSRQLLRTLQGISHHEISEVAGDVILVADDVVPSEAIRLGRANVVGFVIGAGSRTSAVRTGTISPASPKRRATRRAKSTRSRTVAPERWITPW